MSRSRAKGTAAETAVVRFLQAFGFTNAERRALHGAADKGDVAGIPHTVIEVKSCARMELGQWVDEAIAEANNAGVPYGVVFHKRRGVTDPGRWYVSMSGADFAALLARAVGK